MRKTILRNVEPLLFPFFIFNFIERWRIDTLFPYTIFIASACYALIYIVMINRLLKATCFTWEAVPLSIIYQSTNNMLRSFIWKVLLIWYQIMVLNEK